VHFHALLSSLGDSAIYASCSAERGGHGSAKLSAGIGSARFQTPARMARSAKVRPRTCLAKCGTRSVPLVGSSMGA
jgi:hypothetical protein